MAREMTLYSALHIMEMMGPMARRKDCNFPTKDARSLTGNLFKLKNFIESETITSNFESGIEKVIVNEFIINPRYLTVWLGGPEDFSGLKTQPPLPNCEWI